MAQRVGLGYLQLLPQISRLLLRLLPAGPLLVQLDKQSFC